VLLYHWVSFLFILLLLLYTYLAPNRYYVNEIQRVFRGYLGRMRAGGELSAQEASRQLSLFHYYCMQIQRCMRGFYSRKYKHDHERRKRYRARIAAEGDQTRAQMADYALKQAMVSELTSLIMLCSSLML
jgi:hypothetical protein